MMRIIIMIMKRLESGWGDIYKLWKNELELAEKKLKKVLTMSLWLLIMENVKGYTSNNIK